jgi:pimeloyl-ACP methyl ester carboxylesterase
MRHRHNPWLSSPSHSALVPIPSAHPTHSLFAHTTGPPRTSPGEPLLIWFTGAGGPAAIYIALQRQLRRSLNIRCLFYDRAGYDRSTRDPAPAKKSLLARDAALDLWELLDALKIRGRLILAAHSFGGIVAREFLGLVLDRCAESGPDVNRLSIAGVLLFDCATEMMLQLFPRIPPREAEVMGKGVDFERITHLIEESGLTERELAYLGEARERTKEAAGDEDTHASARILAERYQLDRGVLKEGALVVVGTNFARDFELLYEEGLKLGNGTEEERRVAREFGETLKLFQRQLGRAQLDLASGDCRTRYVFLEDVGHDAPLRIRRRDYVGEFVGWILEQVN